MASALRQPNGGLGLSPQKGPDRRSASGQGIAPEALKLKHVHFFDVQRRAKYGTDPTKQVFLPHRYLLRK